MTPAPAPVAPPDRANLLARLEDPSVWDVVVIGGGATGLGTAVDAAARGYRTLLIEAADFAKGTSSRATKLAHGGVRYLAQGNIGLVREALYERGLLHRNAPHMVQPLGFVLPAYGALERPFYGLGLKLYDLLAGSANFAPSRLLSRHETLTHAPTLAARAGGRELRGGLLYFDGQFDDARLAVSLMRTLFDLGGTAVNYMRASALCLANGRVNGLRLQDMLSEAAYTVQARCVINAAGVWVDSVRRMEDQSAPGLVSPSQGVHLALPRDFLPSQCGILIPKTDDGRVLFVVPWNGRTVIGTTDKPRTDLPLEPEASEQEVDFILETAGRYLNRKPTRADITSIWAGLRPLVKATGQTATKSLSREHTILLSPGGLLTITGGKWTTYRKMAQDVLDTAIAHGLLTRAACRTETLALHGAPCGDTRLPEPGSPDRYYGADLAALLALPGAEHSLVSQSGLSAAHVRYAARFELACTVEDVLARRNRALFLDSAAALAAAPAVARILAEELGQNAQWQRRTLEDFAQTAGHYCLNG